MQCSEGVLGNLMINDDEAFTVYSGARADSYEIRISYEISERNWQVILTLGVRRGGEAATFN
jgi:hypothetical protein